MRGSDERGDPEAEGGEVMSQSVLDAMCDAEQLRLFVDDAYAYRFDRPLDPRYYIARKALGDAGYYGFSENPRAAFSAAFRAVPALRDEAR
jgi:hypothetical protein